MPIKGQAKENRCLKTNILFYKCQEFYSARNYVHKVAWNAIPPLNLTWFFFIFHGFFVSVTEKNHDLVDNYLNLLN